MDKWLPMLTHDRCHDIRRKRVDSSEKILGACFEYARASTTEKGKMVVSTRNLLVMHTRRYAESFAELYNLTRVMWTEDFVDMLIEKPESAATALSNYHTKVRPSKPAGSRLYPTANCQNDSD